MTCTFLAWAAEHLAADGVRVLVLIWDNASWHISREVQDSHHRFPWGFAPGVENRQHCRAHETAAPIDVAALYP